MTTFGQIEASLHDEIGIGYALRECDGWWVVIAPAGVEGYRYAFLLSDDRWGLDWMNDMVVFHDWTQAEHHARRMQTKGIKAVRANFGDICRSGRVHTERGYGTTLKYGSSRHWAGWEYHRD